MGYGREMAEDAKVQNFIYGYDEPPVEYISRGRHRKQEKSEEARVKERDAKCEQIMAQCLKCSKKKESLGKEFPGCSRFELDVGWEMCANLQREE